MTHEHLPPTPGQLLSDPDQLAVASAEHGMGDPDGDLIGNLCHLISPVVGALTSRVAGEAEPDRQVVYTLGRLSLALALLQREQQRRARS